MPLETLVSGHVFVDENQNCAQDQNEPPLQNIRIDLQPGNLSAWTNSLGEYVFSVSPGNYTVEHSLQNPWYLGNICPNGPIAVTAIANSNVMNLDFADTIADFVDVVVDFWINPHDSCLLPVPMLVEVCNNGTLPATSIYVTAEVPAFVNVWGVNMDPTSATTWEFTIDTLQAGECTNFYFLANSNCDSTMIGQLACFSADAIPAEFEQDTFNNHYSYCDTVGFPYDPNDLRVLSQIPEQGWLTQEFIDDDDHLTYMIRFQNVGTAPAQNVIIKDTLPESIDFQSIEIISASHDYYAQITNGVLSFNFIGIQLPDSASNLGGSMGYIIFKVGQEFGNPIGTVIQNRAEIYFDQNAPVVTNATDNEIIELTGIKDVEMGNIKLYPNPTTGELFVSNSSARNVIQAVEVMDTQGRLLLKVVGSGVSKIDIGQLSTGIYLIRIDTDKGSVVKRVVRN